MSFAAAKTKDALGRIEARQEGMEKRIEDIFRKLNKIIKELGIDDNNNTVQK